MICQKSLLPFLRLLFVVCQRLNEAEIKMACTEKYVSPSEFFYGLEQEKRHLAMTERDGTCENVNIETESHANNMRS